MNFYKMFLSSKNGKAIWKIIHRILQTTNTMLKANANELNDNNNTEKRVTNETLNDFYPMTFKKIRYISKK